ncbi:chemotaxis regulatory protein CheY [Anatilimnocola aggregata]|uniref:Chemotaxis regulatory protein CheY n=1 Tax=Anatilimnocola aggregata TaxID=2528021 RepID=A0A517Y4E4_9BACT|nr:response regulator [Anatilimnocola aggregata]QDU25087.1 chemotaxis regulatory protein CheY [Anatilimnocola aggregata]
MPKRVLDIGNCSVDHGAIRGMLVKQFNAEVEQTHGPDDSLALLKQSSFDLVLVNRKLDQDYSDGLEIIQAMKADPQLAAVPVMLITNYAQYQEQAVAAGALLGFGKKELYLDSTQASLSKLLK